MVSRTCRSRQASRVAVGLGQPTTVAGSIGFAKLGDFAKNTGNGWDQGNSFSRGRNSTMSYQPIENYGIIGNMRSVALVGMNGSIDWYCFPHFDSPSIFGRILDDKKGGYFQIAPANSARQKQLYWPATNVLITRFLNSDGVAEVTDYMPVGDARDGDDLHRLIRRVSVVRGSVT